MAVIVLDLDGFKDVNDTLGHEQGDVVLVEVARRLAEAVGDDGLVGRLGGDEFCVLLPRVWDRSLPAAVGERIVSALRTPMELLGLRMEVGASIGVAVSPEDGAEATMLMKRADLAMYDAKTSGASLRWFEHRVDTGNARRLSMVSELREAIAQGDLQVHLQPQADAVTGEVLGFEALARWSHPELGPVSPTEFVPVAERSGLIKPLTLAVLDSGLRALSQWREQGLSLAVNLSARCLADAGLVDDVAQALARHGIRPASLVLEVTESAVMADPHRGIDLLQQLHDLGVRLSVDDFGTGYSSLSYLKRLPVHEVKIDRSFVTGLTESSEDFAIVRSIVDLGRNLGLDVVAEGVEDESTWQLLAGLGCTRIQGWYVATPMPIREAGLWLRARAAA
jgi:diguanylate cyclase (GGDEF)-like protein